MARAAPTPGRAGWAALFNDAFRQSRNAMVLLSDRREHLDVNGAYIMLLGYLRDDLIGRRFTDLVVGGPRLDDAEFRAVVLQGGHFTAEMELIRADGSPVAVQWAASVEVVTGQRLILGVALNTSRWGHRFRRATEQAAEGELSPRELEVVRLVALGGTGPEIADELRISNDTVRTHVRNAMIKTGARSRAHLVAKALAEGHALR